MQAKGTAIDSGHRAIAARIADGQPAGGGGSECNGAVGKGKTQVLLPIDELLQHRVGSVLAEHAEGSRAAAGTGISEEEGVERDVMVS